MGWTPGQGLGQDLQGKKDNIKYALKDDLLGIGAKKEYGGGLWRGTSEIDDLYKRLEIGSKVGVVAEEPNVEPEVEKVKLRGGWEMKFQVGDTYTSSFSRTETEVSTPVAEAVEAPSAEGQEKKGKKRKREGEKDTKKKKSKKGKADAETKKLAITTAGPALRSVSEVTPSQEKSRKDMVKKDKTKEKKSKKESKVEPVKAAENRVEVAKEEKKEKRKEKKPKTDKKENKETEIKPEGKPDKPKSKKEKDRSSKRPKDKATSERAVSSATSSSRDKAPNVERNGKDSDRFAKTSRHLHRARFMEMKKASVLNPEALREILGVSA